MSDQSTNEISTEGLTDFAVSHATDAVTGMLTGVTIPEPIKKNASKAFGQLFTALVEVPIAHLEGIAAEKRAETAGRVKLISKGSDQIASQMDMDPAFAQAAVRKFGERIIRQQVNLNSICEIAATQINQQTVNADTEQNKTSEVPEIDSDWLNTFENEASQKSTEEMQLLFGRILAGEIQRPSSFSLKTVKLLGQLDPYAASLFRRLCSLCIYLKSGDFMIDARVASLGGNANTNGLQAYGLQFDNLNILNEYGLIIADYNSHADYGVCIADDNNVVPLAFSHQSQLWGLRRPSAQHTYTELQVSGVKLSRAGCELSSIVELQPDEQYMIALRNYFKGLSLEMIPITIVQSS